MAEGGEEIEMEKLVDHDRDNDDDFAGGEQMMPLIEKTSTSRGARPKTYTTSHSFENPSYVVDSPPTVDKRPITLTEREENRDNAWDRIIDKFPYFTPKISKFTARVDEFNNVKVSLIRRGSVEHNFF